MFYVLAEVPPASDTLAQVRLSAFVVAALVGMAIPIVHGLVMKWTAPGALKGLVTLVLTSAAALVTQATMADGSAVISKQTFVLWLVSLASAVGAYVGILRPVGITNRPNEDGRALLGPNVGIGPRS